MWVGIDPGQKGGIAFLDKKQNLNIHVMPESAGDLDKLLKVYKNSINHLFLEKAQAFKGQGISSTFSYAENYGVIQGILISNSIPFTLITPKEWQKMMFLGTKAKKGTKKRDPKERALEAANRVFAKRNSFWLRNKRCTKPHDGMIDAALLAEACRRMIN